MGWWSKNIMGGDTPLDFEDEIFDIINIDKFDDSVPKAKIAEAIVEHIDEIIEMIENESDMSIGFQVLGFMMMLFGAKMTEEIKDQIVTAASSDEWAAEDEERKEIIDQFIADIKCYDGTPTFRPQPGLFETIAKHLTDGKTGLVNVVPPSE